MTEQPADLLAAAGNTVGAQTSSTVLEPAPALALMPAPDHLPPICYVATCLPHLCPRTFAEWLVTTHDEHTHQLCTPCKERWARHGSVVTAVRL